MRRVSVALVGGVIVGFTIVPRGTLPAGGWTICLMCGDRGLADALLNVLLFLPLGVTLGASFGGRYRPILVAALFSASIELAQAFIPGRDPNLGDLVFNTLGSWIGLEAVRSARWWLRPEARRATWLAVGATTGAGAVLWATGYLLQPAFPHSTYWGQWTPELGGFAHYHGNVVRVQLGSLDLPSWQLAESERVRALLVSGAPLSVRGLPGPRTDRIAPLFSVADDQQRQILLLGLDRDDLVYRFRTRASSLRLDSPDLRLLGARLAARPGDSLAATVRRDGAGYCLRLNREERCGMGYSLGSGWTLLLYPESLPAWLKTLLDHLWVAGLLLPLGWWVRARSPAIACVPLAGAALMLVAPVVGLPATSFTLLLAGVAGLLLGLGGRLLFERQYRVDMLR